MKITVYEPEPEVRLTHNRKIIGFGQSMGEFLGFPSCCTNAFLSATIAELKAKHQQLSNHPLKGTGFVPCDDCIQLPAYNLINTINSQRTYPYPFPHKHRILDSEGEALFNAYRVSKGLPKIPGPL